MSHPPSDSGLAVENTSESTFEERRQGDCPEHESDRKSSNVPHLTTYTLPETDDVAIRSECKKCGEFLGEWDSREKAVAATPEYKFGVCPACNEAAWENRVAGRIENGRLWHKACWYMDQYRFEQTGDDPPIGPREGRPFDLHRTSHVELGDERFEWDEYIYIGKEKEYAAFNLPTRDELRVDQLEQLRKWAVTDNTPGKEENGENNASFYKFPTPFVLLGDYEDSASNSWVCPDCGSIVNPKYESREFTKSWNVDLEARCMNCGSDEWLTRGDPLNSIDQEDLELLSHRERRVIHLKIIGYSTDEIADTLELETSDVLKSIDRLRRKAQRDETLDETLREAGLFSEIEQ